MEVKNEIKITIFAQYWMQKIGITKYTNRLQINRSNIGNIDKISVKPLSDITHEDAIELAKIHWLDSIIEPSNILILPKGSDLTIIEYKKTEYDSDYLWLENKMEKKLCIFQYLQSKGYALPYLNYSVEELVEAGVYELIK